MSTERKALCSWKEIADCLGVTVRSVQRWEHDSGLPVHRQGPGPRARVFAYEDELLRWRESRAGIVAGGVDGQDHQPVPAALPEPVPASRSRLLIPAAVLLAVALVLLGVSGILNGDRIPHGWEFDGFKLTILDDKERICWEKRFTGAVRESGDAVDRVVIADIDGDGSREVLFNYVPLNRAQERGMLFCFDQSGRERWHVPYGAPRTFGDRTFSPNYLARFIQPVKVQGKPLLLTIANHYVWYPSQVALLDPHTGQLIEEYWHPGAVSHYLVHDINADGQPEVLLGAINNPGDGLGHPALAVLTLPFSAAHRRPAPKPDPFPPLTGGGELAYLLLPCPDVDTAMGILPQVTQMAIEHGDRILIQIALPESGGLVYSLDFGLNVKESRFSDNLEAIHHRLFTQKLLDHQFTSAERAALSKVVPFAAAPDGNNPALQRLWSF